MKCKEPTSESGRYNGSLEVLEFGVGVRADFAVQVDLFVLRRNPFHERGSLRGSTTTSSIPRDPGK
jgi:hypothetical protein